MNRNIPTEQEHPDAEAQAPHLQSLHNNPWDGPKITNNFNMDVTSSASSGIQDKWVINLSKRELPPEEKSLLQKWQKFAVTPATILIKEYISTTTVAALQAGEFNVVDCSGLCHDANRILNTYTKKEYIQTSPK